MAEALLNLVGRTGFIPAFIDEEGKSSLQVPPSCWAGFLSLGAIILSLVAVLCFAGCSAIVLASPQGWQQPCLQGVTVKDVSRHC